MTTTIQAHMPCRHGERTDRTTRLGEPICALCRCDAARIRAIPDPSPDWQMIRAADDTLTDAEPHPRASLADEYGATDRQILETLFRDDSRGRRLRHRIMSYL